MNTRPLTALGATVLALLAPALLAQTIPNPGFETGSLSPWTPTGSVSVVQAGAGADNGAIPEGTRVAALSCPAPMTQAKLSTRISELEVGGHYGVSCRVNVQNSLAPVGAGLTVQGSAIATQIQPPVGGSNPYAVLSGAFTATATEATLEVSANSLLNAGTLLVDDFRIVRTDVTTNADSGDGSLRKVLANVAAVAGPDTIVFAPSLAGQTIHLGSTITINDAGGVTMDATGVPGIVIDDDTATSYGLFAVQTGSKVTFRGLTLANGGGQEYVGGGGAITNILGTLTLERCTLSGNASGRGQADGGAILSSGALTLTHCTLSGNSAGAKGGAIHFTGALTLTHCTLSGNSAGPGGGGAIYDNGGLLTLTNTIVAGNTDSAAGTSTDNIVGPVTGSNNVIDVAPQLGPLADNGGPTKTMALLDRSPALDAGVAIEGLVLDQRGFPRSRDGDGRGGARPDIGAYEAQAAPTATIQNPIVVTTTADEADPNGTLGTGLSLREALRDAPVNAEITFDAALDGQTITLSSGLDLPLDKSVSINAFDLASRLTIDGGSGTNRIFTVASGQTATLFGLTLLGGHGHGQDLFVGGGAISNHGTLLLNGCTVSGGSTTTVGGAIFNDATGTLTLEKCLVRLNHADTAGGAIQNVGTLTLTICSFESNTSAAGGAMINSGPMTATNCTFDSNTAKLGGALYVIYTPTLTGCTFTANTASTDGNANTGLGGAIFNENNVVLTGCTFASNQTAGTLTLFDTTSGHGGAIYNPAGKLVTATNCTFSGNSSVYDGGAIASRGSLTITHCTFAGNTTAVGGYGGGIAVRDGTLSLAYSIVAGNASGTGAPGGPDLYRQPIVSAVITPEGKNLIGKNNTVITEFPEGPLVGTDVIPVVANLGPLASNGGPTQTMLPQPGSLAIDAAAGSTTTKDQRNFDRAKDGDGNGSLVADLGAVERGTLLLPVVSTTADDGDGSLRKAIADAATVPDTTITFAAGFTGPIVLASEITVPANAVITVDASNVTAGLVLSGGGTHRLFNVNSGANLTLKGVTLTGGNRGDTTRPGDAVGGAILNDGTLTLTRCTLSGNSAFTGGGAIRSNGTLALTHCTLSGNSAITGGAILNYGTLALTHCTLSGNSATSGGAIFNSGTLALTNTIVAGNTAPSEPDIRSNSGTITPTGKNLIGSTAGNNLSGPNILVGAANLAPLGNYGGRTPTMLPLAGSPAIDAGDNAAATGLTTDQRGSLLPFGASVDIGAVEVGRIVTSLADSGAGSLREAVNSTVAGGMVINFDPVALNGQTIALLTRISLDQDIEINAEGLAAGVTLDAGLLNNRIFRVLAGKTAALHNLTLTRGGGTTFNQFGGAILNDGNLTLTRCTISNSQVKTGNSGGAISSGTGSTLALTDCTLSGNTADFGGAIQTVATLSLNRCTLNGNTARAGNGGAISGTASTLSLTQCTVAGNTATNGNGGGIFAFGSRLTLIHCTIARNTATGTGGLGDGGGVYANGFYQSSYVGRLSVANCILADNTAGSVGPDLNESGHFDAGKNIFNGDFTGQVFLTAPGSANGNGFDAGDNVLTGAAELSALGDNGGPTQTILPQDGSPVRDKATSVAHVGNALAVNFATDQRGLPRSVNGAADLGATEAGSISLTNLALSAGALTPGFAPTTTSYTASVPNATESVTITPTTDLGTITVNGSSVASGAASGPIALTAGQATAITTIVTGLDGATRTYTVTVTRAASTNADLAGLALSMGTLSPGFASGTTAYAAGVQNAVASIKVTATSADASATLAVRVNGGSFTALTSGSLSGALALNVGDNTIDVQVSPQSGTPVIYSVNVHRNARPVLTLPASPVVVTATMGAFVVFTVTASDAEDGALTPTANPPSGSPFFTGDTTVNVSVMDSAGDTANGSFVVRVQAPAVGNTLNFAPRTAAPGAGGPSGLPVGALILTFKGLETTDSGGTAFLAGWYVPSSPPQFGTALFYNNQCLAVVGRDASEAILITPALAEGAAPASAAGVQWKSFTTPVVHAGRMVAIAGLTGTPRPPASVVVTFADGDSALSAVARVGDVAPETGNAVFKRFFAATTHAGNIAIYAQLKGVGVNGANDRGLWLKEGNGPLRLALREGQMTFQGKTIKTLVSFMAGQGSPGQGRGWFTNAFGFPTVNALVRFTDKTNGIIAGRPDGVFTFLTGTGSTFDLQHGAGSDVLGTPGRTFTSLGLPATNDRGDYVFFGKTSDNFNGNWHYDRDDGKFHPLNEDAPAPSLSSVKDPVLAEDGGVAYYGRIADRARPPTVRWKPQGLAEREVATAGGDAADVPGAKWRDFPSLAIMDGRGPLFIGTLKIQRGVVTAATATGVWAYDSTGTLKLLFRAGITQVDVNGTLKTVKSFKLLKAQVGSPGVTHSFNSNGQVTWLATFTDRTTGVVTTNVP